MEASLWEMMMRSTLVFSISGLLGVAGCALTGEFPSANPTVVRQCFNVDQVRNFRQGQPDQIYVRSQTGEVYALDGVAGCQDVDFAFQLAIVPELPGAIAARACVGDRVRIVLPSSPRGLSPCRARVDRVLTADQIAALPARDRP